MGMVIANKNSLVSNETLLMRTKGDVETSSVSCLDRNQMVLKTRTITDTCYFYYFVKGT